MKLHTYLTANWLHAWTRYTFIECWSYRFTEVCWETQRMKVFDFGNTLPIIIWILFSLHISQATEEVNEPSHGKRAVIACTYSKGSGEPAHSHSITRTYAVRSRKRQRNFSQNSRHITLLRGRTSSRKHTYIVLTPLKPHFYIVKLGFTGVYIIFLISA